MRLLAFSITILLGTAALAQTPIDPLIRPVQEPGELRYSFGLSYLPGGLMGIGIDPDLGRFALVSLEHRLGLSARLAYSLDERWSAFTSISTSLDLTQIERRFADQTIADKVTRVSAAGSLGFGYRPAPDSDLDPRLALALEYPWTIRAAASASLVRDPVVLGLSLAYADRLDTRPSSLSLAFSTGFVANERISFTLGKSLSWSVGELDLPGIGLSLRTIYLLDQEAQQEVSGGITLGLRGAETQVTFGLELGGLLR